MPNPFSIHTTVADGVSVITLDGYLDAHTAPEFERAVQSEIDADRVRLVVGCEKLTYISSAGLGVFMSFIEEIRERGGDIKIFGLTPKVRQVFEILGFLDIYDIADDLPTAVGRFSENTGKEG